jgi:hypothetical protein
VSLQCTFKQTPALHAYLHHSLAFLILMLLSYAPLYLLTSNTEHHRTVFQIQYWSSLPHSMLRLGLLLYNVPTEVRIAGRCGQKSLSWKHCCGSRLIFGFKFVSDLDPAKNFRSDEAPFWEVLNTVRTNTWCCYITVDPATPAPWNGVSHFGVLLNRPRCLMLPSLKVRKTKQLWFKWLFSYKPCHRTGKKPKNLCLNLKGLGRQWWGDAYS